MKNGGPKGKEWQYFQHVKTLSVKRWELLNIETVEIEKKDPIRQPLPYSHSNLRFLCRFFHRCCDRTKLLDSHEDMMTSMSFVLTNVQRRFSISSNVCDRHPFRLLNFPTTFNSHNGHSTPHFSTSIFLFSYMSVPSGFVYFSAVEKRRSGKDSGYDRWVSFRFYGCSPPHIHAHIR